MTELEQIFEKTKIGEKISEELKENIKILNVFDDWRQRKNVLIVTKDDRVFSFGSNSFGVLGFGNIEVIEEPTEIPELRDKNIVEFFIAYGFILARDREGIVYSWGTNGYGHLGRGEWSAWNIRHKPEPIKVLNDRTLVKGVKQIVLGFSHGLALTEEGKVFGWGNNLSGQCGCGQVYEYHIDSPTVVKTFEGIQLKKIFAYHLVSFAITPEGKVYSWGDNKLNHLGYESDKYVWDPTVIEHMSNVEVVDVCSDAHYSYFLDKEGVIYYCGQIKEDEFDIYQVLPRMLKTEVKFSRLATDVWNNSKTVALSEDSVYELKAEKLSKTDYKTFEEYFLNEFGIIDKTF